MISRQRPRRTGLKRRPSTAGGTRTERRSVGEGRGEGVCVCSAVTREILQNGILFRGGKRRDASDVPSILLLRRNSITLLKDLCDGFCPPVMRCSLCFVPFLSFLSSLPFLFFPSPLFFLPFFGYNQMERWLG